jgi:hypothetical protein
LSLGAFVFHKNILFLKFWSSIFILFYYHHPLSRDIAPHMQNFESPSFSKDAWFVKTLVRNGNVKIKQADGQLVIRGAYLSSQFR